MNGQIQFLTPENYMPPPKKRLEKGERSNSGGVWFVTALPVIGLFLEIFAVDKYAGAVLWISVIVMMYLGCIADFRSIRHEVYESQEDKLKMLLIFPPAYLFYRDKARTGEGYKGLVLGVLIIAAAFSNGFTDGLALDEENMIPKIENAWVSELDNVNISSDYYIGERLDIWFDNGFISDCTRSGDVFTIVFTGTHEEKDADVVIEVVHDGFAYQSIKAKGVVIDGKELEGDERIDALTDIFIDDTEESDDTEELEE